MKPKTTRKIVKMVKVAAVRLSSRRIASIEGSKAMISASEWAKRLVKVQ
jgi:hypothetical protein